jgi:hypothetical protein
MADNQANQQQWLKDMASNAGGSKVDLGPGETVASVPGRAKPKRGKAGGSRVPPPTAGQVRKL